MSKYLRIDDQAAHDRAMSLARGSFQRDLLEGRERLSLMSLRGKAAQYRARYHASANNLLDRLTAEGVAWHEERGPHSRRVLVIGS